MSPSLELPIARFLQILEIVAKEGKHLSYSWNNLSRQAIDTAWLAGLEHNPDCAEQLEAFVSRFGRMQDRIADKLLPRRLLALAEKPDSQIETLNRAERLGVLVSTERWLEARSLRRRLIHEYITDPSKFIENVILAKEYTVMLMDTFNRVRLDAMTRMQQKQESLPEPLTLPGGINNS